MPYSLSRSRFTLFSTTLLILAMLWIWQSRVLDGGLASGTAPIQGFSAPGFSLPGLDGSEVQLADHRGQVVLVNIWASWCPPCRAEMPAMQRVYDAYQVQGLEILAVNLTAQDSQRAAVDFVQELGLSFPILFDHSGEVGRTYRASSLPISYFIDRAGVIREIVVGGPMSEALLRTRIERLLE
jgi:cytochrome c biogenesis protein CcmG, thiol:disulfide interchange protein DsbE